MVRRVDRGTDWRVGVAVLVVALLAGCSSPNAAPDAASLVPERASLLGVVVDEAIRPIAGAMVTIPALPDVSNRTAADGTFRLDGLAPGTVVVQVAKPGYLTATAQLAAVPGTPSTVAKVVLAVALETQPYVVQESYDGFLSCGLGSSVVFGLSAGCEALSESALGVVCRGQDPIPPTGVCVSEGNSYYSSQARGNVTMVQTELTWQPTFGTSDLMVVQWAVDGNGQLIKGIGSAAGPSFLVSRLNSTVLREFEIGGANSLSVYVSVSGSVPANAVIQQPYRVFHETAYYFEFEPDWTFIEDGAPIVPPTCTTCLVAS